MCSSAPTDPLIGQAAAANAEVAQNALDFYQSVYQEGAPQRDEAAAIANQTAQQQMDIAAQNQANSQNYFDYQQNTFRPLEQGIVADAVNYDTAQRREQQSGEAMQGVRSAFDAQRLQMARSAAANGVNPNSGNFAGQMRRTGVMEAVAAANAGNNAIRNVETQGYARKMDAANLGRGLASNQATSAGVALNAGNSAVQNAGVPLTQQNQAAATMGQGFNTAIQGNNSSGQMALGVSQANAQQNGATMGALGTMAGAGIALLSDKNSKEAITPTSTEKALTAVEKTPIKEWQYKDSAVASDGGQRHIGPMAQDVNRNMGEKAAPKGKVIDVITMQGINMAAIQEISKKVKALEKKVT